MMRTQEEWKPVVGYEGLYECSDMGRVRSLPRNTTKGGILKPQPNEQGYLKIDLYKNGKKSIRKVHILIMRAFVGECPDGYEVDHINFKQDDNRLENLRYLPAKENHKRKSPEWQKNVREGAKKRAADPEWLQNVAEANRKKAQDPEWRKNQAEAMKKHSQDPEYLKKTAEAVRKALCKPVKQYSLDGVFIKRWPSATDAAKELGFSQGNISLCCQGKRKSAGGFIWRFAD